MGKDLMREQYNVGDKKEKGEELGQRFILTERRESRTEEGIERER